MLKKDILEKISSKDLKEKNFFMTGYDNLYTRLKRIVTRKGNNNTIIVGDGGIGKTTLAKSLAFEKSYTFYQLQKDTLSEIIFSYQPNKEDIQSIKTIFTKMDRSFIFIDDIVTLFSEEDIFF